MSDLIASTLGDYRVEGLVGQGGIGQVFRGAHVHLGTAVALKVIDSKYTSAPGFKTRFVQYAQTITSLVHPNLVKVYHCGEQDGLSYVVMELITGGVLPATAVNQPWTDASWSAVMIVKQAADALAVAHRRGLTHGDVKRSNVLLTTTDLARAQAKLSDLGLLQLVDPNAAPSSEGSTRAAALVSDPSRDLIALGGLLYEVTTGQSVSKTPHDTPPGYPEELSAVLRRCVAADPAERFPSCEALSAALDSLLIAGRGPGHDLAVVEKGPPPQLAAKTAAVVVVAKRPSVPPKPPAAPVTGGPMIPSVYIFDESGTPVDMQFVRGSGLTIGRALTNTVILDQPNVSLNHVRVDWDMHRITITDLGSSHGTLLQGQRLLPQVAQEWAKEQWLQVGSFWLWLQRPVEGPPPGGSLEIVLDHQSRVMTIAPGTPAVCRLSLVNATTEVAHIRLSVEGVPAAWVEGANRVPQLQPFEKQEITFPINVPKSSAGRAGDYAVTIAATVERTAAEEPEARPATATARWTVLPFEAMGVSIAPARAGGLREARYVVTLHHDGNRPASYVLTGSDDDKQLECLFSAEDAVDRNRLRVDVQPGTKANVKLKVTAPRRWFGSSHAYPFSVVGTPVDAEQLLTTEGQFTHRALLPIWLMAAIPLLVIAIVLVLPAILKPVVTRVTVDPRNPMVGQKLVIGWEASRARNVRLFLNDIPVLPDPNVSPGKYEFADGFRQDTRVRVLASNRFGEAPMDLLVPVSPVPPPPPAPPADAAVVELFEVRPLSTVPDGEVTIRWRVKGASRVELTPIGTVDVEGSTVHSPPSDQTYTLTAFNKDNVATTRTLMVRVRQPTISGPSGLTLTATSREPKIDPLTGGMTIGVGQLVVFHWQAENAAKARIDATTPVALEGASGQKTAELRGEGTYTFTLVATNDKGQEFRSKPVAVQASCKGFPVRVITFKFGCNKNRELLWK